MYGRNCTILAYTKQNNDKYNSNKQDSRHSRFDSNPNNDKCTDYDEEREKKSNDYKSSSQTKTNHYDQKTNVNESQMEIDEAEKSTEKNDANNRLKNPNQKKELNAHLEDFRQKRSAFTWLTQQFDRSIESDQFKRTVVRSTFPENLSQRDFDYYIDMTFDDLPSELRTRLKDLFERTDQNPITENLMIDNASDGSVSASLVQILSYRNARNNLEMLAGSISLNQRPSKNKGFTRAFLEQHEAKVKNALQYLFGEEALKESSLE